MKKSFICLILLIGCIACEADDQPTSMNENFIVLGSKNFDFVQLSINGQDLNVNEINISEELSINSYEDYSFNDGILSVFNLLDSNRFYQKDLNSPIQGISLLACERTLDQEQLLNSSASKNYLLQHTSIVDQEIQLLRFSNLDDELCELIEVQNESTFEEIEIYDSYLVSLNSTFDKKWLYVYDLNSKNKIGQVEVDLDDKIFSNNGILYVFTDEKILRFELSTLEQLSNLDPHLEAYSFQDQSRLMKLRTHENKIELIKEILPQPAQFNTIPAILDLETGEINDATISPNDIYVEALNKSQVNLSPNFTTINLNTKQVYSVFDVLEDFSEPSKAIIAITNFRGENLKLVQIEANPIDISFTN